MIQKLTRKKIRFAYLSILLIWILGIAFSSNPPNGRTGAPGEGLCTDCHTPGGATQDGDILLTNFPASITANQSYSLTLTMNNPDGTADKGGFQMTILNGSNEQAGSLSMPSSSTVVTPSGGREYWEHNPALDFPGSNQLVWTVDWTAPNGPDMDQITFYVAGNVANGNGNTSGDLIAQNMGSGTLMGGADPLTAFIIAFENTSCNGEATGGAIADGSGGTPPYSFNWSNGDTGDTALGLAAGTYTVTVTDQNNNTATTSIEITEPDAVEIMNPVVNHVSCAGESDGSIAITPAGGSPGYAVEWSNGSTANDISSLTFGTYSVTVSDLNGCSASQSFTITQPELLEILNPIVTDVSCSGESDGSISIIPGGGTPGYTVTWSNGSAANIISGLFFGNYSVTVSDANSCSVSQSFTVTQPTFLDLNIETQINVMCSGDATGEVELMPSGGTEPYEIDWSNGSSGTVQTGLPAGNYMATVSDANLCQNTLPITISEPDELIVDLSIVDNAFCFGENTGGIEIFVDGGVEPYSVDWSNGQTGTTILNIVAGDYTVTATDANNCTTTLSVMIGEPDEILITTESLQNASCFGGADGSIAISISGGTEPYDIIEWSNGFFGTNPTDLASGSYTVTVMDVNICSATATITVGAPEELITNASSTDETMFAANDGTATAIPTGGTAPYTFLWNTGSTTSTITNLPPGQYTVTVTDANNCTSIQTVAVNAFGCLFTITTIATQVLCNGASDGAIEVTVGGNAAEPIVITWSTGDTTLTINSLSPGQYSVSVTDANNCQQVELINITEPLPITVNCDVTEISGAGMMDGAISCTASGGTGVLTYLWSTNEISDTIESLGAGNYLLTVTDENNCMVTSSITLNDVNCMLILTANVQDIACNGDSTGEITIFLNGASEPISYNWSNGDNTSTITKLKAGEYSVTSTDANNCSVSDTFQINELPPIIVLVDTIIHADMAGNDGSIVISVSGGLDPLTYVWLFDGNVISTEMNPTELEGGFYSVIVTDSEGCSTTLDSIEVEATVGFKSIDHLISWKIYPNPTSEMLSVEMFGLNVVKLQIMNAKGLVVSESELLEGRTVINLAQYPEGLYYLRVANEQGSSVKKFIRYY